MAPQGRDLRTLTHKDTQISKNTIINLDVSCYVNSVGPDQPIYDMLSDRSLQCFFCFVSETCLQLESCKLI